MGRVVEANRPAAEQSPPNEFSVMDAKPIVTYAGDKNLFSSLEGLLVQRIPQEATEWKRSYGRPVKSVFTEAIFAPFNRSQLPKDGDWHLIGLPIFHTYWTECVDVDIYKTSVREDIDLWLKTLQKFGIEDWLIVQVETYDIKRSNKLLPRTTVLDKIRSDFASKHPDRCISVINPIRSESKSAETWRGLLSRIRVLLLQAYDSTLVRFEETIRKQRERRIEPGWSFCKYFLLQEELAFVLEMLGLFEEALVQYDELDALFTQFVLNYSVGETPNWLSTFQGPLESWPGLQLTHKVNQEQRLLIQNSKASLLQFRSYLFSRQSAMLLLTLQPWEIAKRTLPFLHNCIAELRILEVTCPPGSVACWIFLGCLEVLRTCEQFNDSTQVQKYSRFTASLWAYASEKLKELGELCGLLPGMQPTSEQLHLVVGLSAGMGDVPLSNEPTPTDQLKEALSSNVAFKKHYLEFAELAMGTFKHINRVRLARVIGRDLAAFHQRLGDYQTASLFLDAALRMLEVEGWRSLAVETRQELVLCYHHTEDKEKYVKTCASLACSHELDVEKRMHYLNQMVEVLSSITSGLPLVTQFTEAFEFLSVEVKKEKQNFVVGGNVEVVVELQCLLPRSMPLKQASLSIEKISKEEARNEFADKKNTNVSSSLPQPEEQLALKQCLSNRSPDNPLLSRITMNQCLDYQQDQSLKAAWASCRDSRYFLRQVSQRADSQGNHRTATASLQTDFSLSASTENITLEPGKNSLSLQVKVTEPGKFQFGQMSIKMCEGHLEFLSNVLRCAVGFEVTSEHPTVSVHPFAADLLAGLVQEVTLVVNTGSQWVGKGSKLTLRPSEGLQVQLAASGSSQFMSRLEVSLPETEPFQTIQYSLQVFAALGSQRDNSVLEHKVDIDCPWSNEAQTAVLQFHPPFFSSLRLHTSHCRKFAQVLVTGLTKSFLQVTNMDLTLVGDCSSVQLLPLNPKAGQPLMIRQGFNVMLLWELEVAKQKEEDSGNSPVQAVFTMSYQPILKSETSERIYKCSFDINDYRTLIVVSAKVEPSKGSEFCRASTMCHLHLTVERVSENLHSSLMYEVLVDQTMWAVCGRTTGVVTLDESHKQTIQLDVMPLISGYLPVPQVRLSKYIPADQKPLGKGKKLLHCTLVESPSAQGRYLTTARPCRCTCFPPLHLGRLPDPCYCPNLCQNDSSAVI
ncbi:Trafficking protein particle complex subunit 10 [Frankliniella fusca]|uniref:Trafficking protein particle complex subunit 10 n=1 Tax=Frankliniella fusca TaxID=407009 RepID=A0AAE1LNR9_9NEOP|nr:Trafficking protein particle complex subunit 10 [Frankliniella fusca]